MQLADATSLETAGAMIVLVPVGSLEQHGPHLPLDTDTLIATYVARAVASRLQDRDVWVAPAIAYGSSGEHQSFPGTVSIGTDVLRLSIVELVRSLRTWTGHVVLINGHGGNVTALVAAVDQLVAEGHDVDWVACASNESRPGDLHAGHTETSLMLHLAPWAVRMHRAESGSNRPLTEALPLMRAGGVAAVSPNGVLGDPLGATAQVGARIYEDMTNNVIETVLGHLGASSGR